MVSWRSEEREGEGKTGVVVIDSKELLVVFLLDSWVRIALHCMVRYGMAGGCMALRCSLDMKLTAYRLKNSFSKIDIP